VIFINKSFGEIKRLKIAHLKYQKKCSNSTFDRDDFSHKRIDNHQSFCVKNQQV